MTSKTTPSKRLFKTEEASQYLGISERMLRKLTDLGSIPTYNFVGRRAYRKEDLDHYIESLEKWTPQKMRGR